MFINNLLYNAFFSALIILSLSNNNNNNFAYGEELGVGKSCVWSDWSEGPCSVECGDGIQIKTRNCICSTSSQIPNCIGEATETCACKMEPCCNWSDDWGLWSDCKNGNQSRTKNCICNNSSGSVNSEGNGYEAGDDDSNNNNNSGSGSINSKCSGVQPIESRVCESSSDNSDNNNSGSNSDNSGYNSGSNNDNSGSNSDNNGYNSGSNNDNSGSNSGSSNNNSGSGACRWSDWEEFGECSKACGSGFKTRTRKCVCGSGAVSSSSSSGANSVSNTETWKRGDSYATTVNGQNSIPESQNTDSYNSGSVDENTDQNMCEGLAQETVSCNEQSCCSWNNTSFSEWTICEGGVRRRYAMCYCNYSRDDAQNNNNNDQTNYNNNNQIDMNCEDQIGGNQQQEMNITDCIGSQPYQEENCTLVQIKCPKQEEAETPNCVWEGWSEWTKCDKFCNGVQFRRQLCTCYDDNTDNYSSDSHNDSLCVGIPLSEIQSCNKTENDELCRFSWGYLDEWSPCVSDNHYCGNGTQWRRQYCLGGEDNGTTVYSDENCMYNGDFRLFEKRECKNQDCCEFGQPIYVDCNSLLLENSSLCVTPWAERQCMCPDNTNNNNNDQISNQQNYHQCIWTRSTIDNPPINYDFLTDHCLNTNSGNQELTNCYEYASNDSCLSWNVRRDDSQSGQEVFDKNGCGVSSNAGDCESSAPNCWDGWSDWSPCAGTCDEAYQWRRQTTSKGISSCRQPPSFEYRSCELTDCCKWIYDDTLLWSNCSSFNNGASIKIRFPYTCSCGDDQYLCPPPSDCEIETQSCEMDTITVCKFEEISEPTLCNTTSGEAWYTQNCICDDSENSTSDIGNCYGAPMTFTQSCECPNNSDQSPSNSCEWREIVSECLPNCSQDNSQRDDEDDNSETHGNQENDSSNQNNPKVGCLTVTRSCYCNGLLTDSNQCSAIQLPLTQTLPCAIDSCDWINHSEWSPCTNGTQYQTRECSCEDEQEQSNQSLDNNNSDTTNSYSQLCNGYSHIIQSCQSTNTNTPNQQVLSSESWRTASWPQPEDTQSRTFSCSTETWYQLISKSSCNDWESLAVEYITAQLNLLSGVSCDDQFRQDLQSTENLLSVCSWSPIQAQEAQSYLTKLRQFNHSPSNNISKRIVKEKEDPWLNLPTNNIDNLA